MSVLYKSHETTLLDHRSYISNIYRNVCVLDSEVTHFTIMAQLFSIYTCKKKNSRKRSNTDNAQEDEMSKVKEIYKNSVTNIPLHIKKDISLMYNILDTTLVRSLSRQLFESTIFDHIGSSGANMSKTPLKCTVKNETFLIPQNSRFMCGCVREQCIKLLGKKFDILIADPPWWNKYIRRLKGANSKLSYSMMHNEEIADIPVKDLLSDNCLVAVWCTNAPSNIAAVKQLILPKWGVEYVTTWYWLKMTRELEPVCDFGIGCQKQPYERIILGKVGEIRNIPNEHLIMSVPSALHSHKPPLLELLQPYVCENNPQVLELFARYLLPNTTSIGYEPLKWQHISLYETVS